jgi:hypothetical protein
VVSPTGQSLARLIEQARSPRGAPVCVWPFRGRPFYLWAIPSLNFVSFLTPLCQFLLEHDDFLQGVRMVVPLELQLAFQVRRLRNIAPTLTASWIGSCRGLLPYTNNACERALRAVGDLSQNDQLLPRRVGGQGPRSGCEHDRNRHAAWTYGAGSVEGCVGWCAGHALWVKPRPVNACRDVSKYPDTTMGWPNLMSQNGSGY